MRKSSGLFVGAFFMTLIIGISCGTIFNIGYGFDDKLKENFEICIILIIVTTILTTTGAILLIKERKSNSKRNKAIIDKMNESYDDQGNRTEFNENSISDRKRISPRKEIIKDLLTISGNKCNFYPCPNILVDYKGHLQGHVISIMSNEKNQPNYNPKLSNEDRIKKENLMFLCLDHFIDLKMQEKFTVDTLIQKKSLAEESFAKDKNFEANDQIIEEIIDDYMKRYL